MSVVAANEKDVKPLKWTRRDAMADGEERKREPADDDSC
jgi:hypothetical protein